MNITERNYPDMNEELTYVKHETEILTAVKNSPEGLTIKEISQSVGITGDATYSTCTSLLDENKLTMRKEKRGAGKSQNIYTIPELAPNQEGGDEQLMVVPTSSTPWPFNVKSTNENYVMHPVIDRWGELKNRLILNGDCGEALKIMVAMEEEARP